MRLTTRSRFALTAMVDVALHCGDGPVALSAISERHGISLSYLEILFSALRRAGLVVSTRGPGGGYALAKSAADITTADIALAAEERKTREPAATSDAMSVHQGAMTHELWLAFNQTLLEHLSSVPLAELVEQHLATGYVPQKKPVPVPAPKHYPVQPQRQLPPEGVPNSVFALAAAMRWR